VTTIPVRDRRGFRDGLRLARDAARRLVRRRDLLLVVIVLAAAGSISTTLVINAGGGNDSIADSSAGRRTGVSVFVYRWQQAYVGQELEGIVWRPASAYVAPLKSLTDLVPWWRWIGRSSNGYGWWFAISLVLAWVVWLLLYVGLLGWIRDSDKPIRLLAWPGYWRRHLPGVVLVTLLAIAVGWASTWAILRAVSRDSIAWQLAIGLSLVVYTPFFLAPFVVVGRKLGASDAIVEGWRLLRDNWAALLALFVIYRVGYELLSVFTALTPWEASAGVMQTPAIAAGVAWDCAYSVGFGVLGLWLACAFMEIAKGREVVPVSE